MKLSFRTNIYIVIMVSILLMLGLQTYSINLVNKTSNEQVVSFVDMTVSQIENNLNTMFKNTRYSAVYLATSSVAKKYMSTTDPMELFSVREYLKDYVRTIVSLDTLILNALLVDNQGNVVYSYGDTGYAVFEEIQEYSTNISDRVDFFYVQKNEMQSYLLCMTSIYSDSATFAIPEQKTGTVAIILHIQEATKALKNIDSNGQADIFLLSPDDTIIASNSSAAPFSDQTGSTYVERAINDTDFRLTARINHAKVSEDYDFFRSNSIIICVIMVTLLLIIGTIFNHTIARPTQQVITEVTSIGNDRRKKKISGEYGAQLNPLVQSINQMIAKIDALDRKIFNTQKEMYEKEILRQKSNLFALRNQINPHFIFNTLQCMGGIAIMHGERKVAEIAASMSELFHYALKDGNIVSIHDEFVMLDKYLKITSERFPGKFTWEMDIPEPMRNYRIVKMLLQPLVENAIHHGIERRIQPSGGMLLIALKEEDDYLFFTVKDNGSIDEETLTRISAILLDTENLTLESNTSKRIGLMNIQYRIKLIYGQDCLLSLTKEEQYTVSRLKIKNTVPANHK